MLLQTTQWDKSSLKIWIYVDVNRAIQEVTGRWPGIRLNPREYKNYPLELEKEKLQTVKIPIQNIIYDDHLTMLKENHAPFIIVIQIWVKAGEKDTFFIGNEFRFIKP
ncbi:MAG: hypothetical protein NC898_04945 [Candidatus Omnitrophica bacterium]|nr:hypothetical protein [Candidatus Omnitrophota bacterium]